MELLRFITQDGPFLAEKVVEEEARQGVQDSRPCLKEEEGEGIDPGEGVKENLPPLPREARVRQALLNLPQTC